jgi:biopolymer transport protein ExbD
MPVTDHAPPMPDADQQDALIATVTGGGTVYVGVSLVDLGALKDELARNLSRGIEKKLYVKADAQAPYATVMKVLDVAAAAGIEKTVLLTTQHDSLQPGTVSPPRGFTVVTRGSQAATRPRLSL